MSRESTCLNGEWEFMPLYHIRNSLELPEKLTFESTKIRVPSSWRYCLPDANSGGKIGFGIIGDFQPYNLFNYPEEWNLADTGIYRTFFLVGGAARNTRAFLRFEGIMQRARVIVNGSEVTRCEDAYLPMHVEITDYVRRGGASNELLVVCTGFEECKIESGSVKSLGLIGSWYGNICRGVWQDVYLELYPTAYIEDAFIATSVRKESVSIIAKTDMTDFGDRDLAVRVEIYDGNSSVLTLGPATIRSETDSVELQSEWPGARFWSPDDPFLYTAEIVLLDGTEETDRKAIRFGFREFWCDGPDFYLNGIRINLRGDSWHFQGAMQQTREYALNWYQLCKENGVNLVRLHAEPYPSCYLDAADETGMLLVDETAIYGSSKSMPAGHPLYLQRCKEHARRLTIRDRNHPSVIIWSLENEMRWVDGRDEYKLHIPEIREVFKAFDGTRPIIEEGDNRLVAGQNVEIESYHYNIDGTIAQWKHRHPLVFGEHGGWWYLCPQNSSAYVGLDAYTDYESCIKGFAFRERLYVEYARRAGVSGITSFNFVHYMMHSMPDRDVPLRWNRLDTPGCKPQVIRRYSLTLNNGLLEHYPLCRPNAALEIMREAYHPCAVIAAEYDTSFYDDKKIERNFDVYNDTLSGHKCRLEITVKKQGEHEISRDILSFLQQPGEKNTVRISFQPPKVEAKVVLYLEATLYHEETMVFRLRKQYAVNPRAMKSQALEHLNQKAVFVGSDHDFSVIRRFLPTCKRQADSNPLDADILIFGSHLDENVCFGPELLKKFVARGGVFIQLEQSLFVSCHLSFSQESFFSAHISAQDHPILQGIVDEDLIFWHPLVDESGPKAIIHRAFRKPEFGDVAFLLECSAGDFGDGGDLWTPLFEYDYGRGRMIFCQLELMENVDTAPAACLLLRNLLSYAISCAPRESLPVAVLSPADSQTNRFFEKIGLEFERVVPGDDPGRFRLLVLAPEAAGEVGAFPLEGFVRSGGKVLVMPIQPDNAPEVSRCLNLAVCVSEAPTYQLIKPEPSPLTNGVSVTDLFGFDKVTYSPRVVENVTLCSHAILVKNSVSLLRNAIDLPWKDYYVSHHSAEYSNIALADINRENKDASQTYLAQCNHSGGSIVFSQILPDRGEKSARIYTRLLANMGAGFHSGVLDRPRGDEEYSVDFFMTLPVENWQDAAAVEAYYTDPEFSLNNLGEGLYGWMKKIEKDRHDGFIRISGSSGKKFFLTCFVEYPMAEWLTAGAPDLLPCLLDISSNSSFTAWINGQPVCIAEDAGDEKPNSVKKSHGAGVYLSKGINRIVFLAESEEEDILLRLVFLSLEGHPLTCLRYRLTLDEVDPK